MKIFKKLMLSISLGMLSATAFTGVSSSAPVMAPLTLDFENQSFAFRGEGEGIVSFDAVKVVGKGDSATLKWNEKAKWDTYDVTESENEVDLSSRKTTKDLLVAVQDIDAAASIVFWVPADTSKYKGKYESGNIKITDGSNTVGVDELYQGNTARFEYRTENGNWKDYMPDETNLAIYEQEGATLYFRRKAVIVDSNGYTAALDKLNQEDRKHVSFVCKAKGAYFASKEFKVKIPKNANAPSIGVDYNQQVLKVKDTMEYRTRKALEDPNQSASEGKWTEVPAGVKELKLSDLFEYSVEYGGTVEVRIKANASKNKPASKPYIFKFPEAPQFLSDNFGMINKNGINGDGLPDKGLIFELSRKKGKNYCLFTNTNPDATYEIYSSNPYENKQAKKIAILKAPQAGGKTQITVDDKKVPEKAVVYVLIAGDKKQKRFRSNAVPVGGVSAILYPTEDTE